MQPWALRLQNGETVIKCCLYIDLRRVRGLISCSLNNTFHRSFLNIVILKLDAFMAISSIILRDRCTYILRKFLAWLEALNEG